MKFVLGFFFLALFAVPAKSQAEQTTGNYLLVSCQLSIRGMEGANFNNQAEAWKDGNCIGLVRGVYSALPTACAAPNVTAGQMIRVVVKYLQDHPEKLNLRDVDLIRLALEAAFPCKN
jgi:hypothetical protein